MILEGLEELRRPYGMGGLARRVSWAGQIVGGKVKSVRLSESCRNRRNQERLASTAPLAAIVPLPLSKAQDYPHWINAGIFLAATVTVTAIPMLGVGLWSVTICAISIGAFWLAVGYNNRAPWWSETSRRPRRTHLRTMTAGPCGSW
jgi:hypothetical protein